MSEAEFKTMRHIETTRNYLNCIISQLMHRQEQHDQSKLESPEVEVFEEFTPKLRDTTYGSKQYMTYLREMGPAITHHHAHNRHHPEYFTDRIKGMNLVDLIEMLCDWKSATLRHNDGDLTKSIEMNQKRFKYSDDVKQILLNTAELLGTSTVYHKAEES